MKRELWTAEHELFREQFRRYAKREIEPEIAEWNARGQSDKASWRPLGAAGYLGVAMPERYGGSGGDFLYAAIVVEELADLRAHALQTSLF